MKIERIDMKHRYKLQEYRGANTRHTCPKCGHKNEFTRYVDQYGKILDESCGRCNREKCGYHLTPNDFFKMNGKPKNTTTNIPTLTAEKRERLYIKYSANYKDTHRKDNNLWKWMSSVYGESKANKVFDLYKVNTIRHWRYKGGYSTAFQQIDEQSRIMQVKVMAYNPTNGKRLKKDTEIEIWNTSKNAFVKDTRCQDRIFYAGKSILHDYNANLEQGFFGQHLIREGVTIGIVESEKTAMICTLEYPDIVWIATGGCNGCKWTNENVYRVLRKAKRVALYPDSGMYEKWIEKAIILRKGGVNITKVSKYCEGYTDNTDIADIIIAQRTSH